MAEKTEKIIQAFLKKDLVDVQPGNTVKIYQKIPGEKERIQVFEGVV